MQGIIACAAQKGCTVERGASCNGVIASAQIGDVIAYLREKGGMAIVLVEQYFEFAWRLADSFTVLERGRVTLEGRKESMDRARLFAAVSV